MMITMRIKMISLLLIFILLSSCSNIVFEKFDKSTGNLIFKIWREKQQ
jgi:hypothetical protein